MDLSSVTTVGVLAFLVLKFAGYILAFSIVKKIQPAIQSGALLMASTRTVLGVIAGGALYFVWNHTPYKFSYGGAAYYLVLTFIRVLIWVIVTRLFTRGIGLRKEKVYLYVFSGTLWSSFMDIPAAFFAFLVPGGVLFC